MHEELRNLANEAFARVRIGKLLKDAGWPLSDGRSVRFAHPLDDGRKANAMYHP